MITTAAASVRDSIIWLRVSLEKARFSSTPHFTADICGTAAFAV
jgi:hypothetical protein